MTGKIRRYRRRSPAPRCIVRARCCQCKTCRCARVCPIPRGPAKAHRHRGKNSSSRGTKAARWRAARGRPEAAPRSRRLDCAARAATDSAGDRGHSQNFKSPQSGRGRSWPMYDQCEEIIGAEVDEILRQLQNFPEVKVLPHVNTPFVIEAARRALARAGYDLEL